MSECDDTILLTEIDHSGRETAIASICDQRWESGLLSHWRGGGSSPPDVGRIFREAGEHLFYEQMPDGSRGARLSRHLVWVYENGLRRYTYVAFEACPHFRFVDRHRPPRPRHEPLEPIEPSNVAVATSFAKGEASGRRSRPRGQKVAGARRLDRMVSVLMNLIKIAGGNVFSSEIPQVDTQLMRLRNAGNGMTIGRLKRNPLPKLYRVQPTTHGLDELGRELWRDNHKWSLHEKPHALVLVVGRLGPGKCVTWRSPAGPIRLVLKKRAARSSPRANTGPYLILLSLGRGATPGSWQVTRAGAVAVVSRTILLPIDSKYERPMAKALIKFLVRLPEGTVLEKPLPGQAVKVGNHSILPDFILRLGPKVFFIEVMGDKLHSYVTDKREDARDLQTIGHAITIDMVTACTRPSGTEMAINQLEDSLLGLILGPTKDPEATKLYTWLPEDDASGQESA